MIFTAACLLSYRTALNIPDLILLIRRPATAGFGSYLEAKRLRIANIYLVRPAKRRPPFDCAHYASSPDGIDQSSNYFDPTKSTHPPLVIPVAPHPHSLDSFPQTRGTDLTRPLYSPPLTLEEQAQLQLRIARLGLVQQLGYRHPLSARVKLNGTLRLPVFQPQNSQPPHESRLPRRRSWLPSPTRRGEQQRRSESGEAELADENRRNTEVEEAYGRYALKAEVKRRNALKEVHRRNANLEKQIHSRRMAFGDDDCVRLGDELDEGMMFSIELGLAV